MIIYLNILKNTHYRNSWRVLISTAPLVSNWTQRVVEYARGNEEKDDGCRLFEGSFLLSATALYNSSYTAGYGVKCKCPGTDGHKYCSCLPFYQGQECNRMVCLNGGIEVTNRCQCPQYFLGYHCEIDTNRTMHQTPRFTRYPENGDLFTRDISGTAFSLIMIILLIASLYLLLKHRLQQQMNNNNTRRAEHAVFCLRDDPLRRVSPFVSQGILAPPPYSTGNQSRSEYCVTDQYRN
ncbi:hypothetical protein WR25_13187 [Diploscapter pachys]|uniref:EGF-like domain-containing protein n=1 Tax=Diploscapter pachys TaxID=2018661 RepID=A0A2A2KPY5_9BILA|nr:hypothetical protein WR25_13187 [Diploscapter pachys]